MNNKDLENNFFYPSRLEELEDAMIIVQYFKNLEINELIENLINNLKQ